MLPHTLARSDLIGATEGYKCRTVEADTNTKPQEERVDLKHTCDDTLPTWELLKYSQRFVTDLCVDTVMPPSSKTA